MSDADQHEPNREVAPGGNLAVSGEQTPLSKFEIVPYAEAKNEQELYSFREAMAPPPAEPAAKDKKNHSVSVAKILLALLFLACVGFGMLEAPWLFRPKPASIYTDLGSHQFHPAGLSGRLIVRWQKSGSYQLFLDPIDPERIAGFAAVAQDPPRQLSVTIYLRDAAGLAVCQKEILLASPWPQEPDAKPGDPTGPQQTESGDTVQNMTGENGQIAEIDTSGPLPCQAKAFTSFKTWNFSSDFPTPAEQDEWLRHEKESAEKAHGGKGFSAPIAHLSVPIEGDDVIVGDNPSRGTVQTSSGRVFFVGTAGARSRGAGWQVFPAPIHFRCDKSGSCTLSRSNSNVPLHARLLK